MTILRTSFGPKDHSQGVLSPPRPSSGGTTVPGPHGYNRKPSPVSCPPVTLGCAPDTRATSPSSRKKNERRKGSTSKPRSSVSSINSMNCEKKVTWRTGHGIPDLADRTRTKVTKDEGHEGLHRSGDGGRRSAATAGLVWKEGSQNWREEVGLGGFFFGE